MDHHPIHPTHEELERELAETRANLHAIAGLALLFACAFAAVCMRSGAWVSSPTRDTHLAQSASSESRALTECYVDPESGNDCRDRAHPCKTLKQAVGCMGRAPVTEPTTFTFLAIESESSDPVSLSLPVVAIPPDAEAPPFPVKSGGTP